MTDRQIRASDQERESVVDVLRDAFTEGRLSSDELEERTASAYTAKTWAQLGELTSDLPVPPPLGASLNRPQRASAAAAQAKPPVRRAAVGLACLDRDLGRLRGAESGRRTVLRVHLHAGLPDRYRGR